jgi:hypothetical protein
LPWSAIVEHTTEQLGRTPREGGIAEMLRVVPDGWFSYDFTVFDRRGMPVSRAELANWRETAKLEVGATRYKAHHKGWGSKQFVLEKEDGRVFEHGGNRYEVEKESVWGSAFVIRREGVVRIGSVRGKGIFKREWIVELPEELLLEVRVFIVWLVVLLWKRAASGAAATAGAVGACG